MDSLQSSGSQTSTQKSPAGVLIHKVTQIVHSVAADKHIHLLALNTDSKLDGAFLP